MEEFPIEQPEQYTVPGPEPPREAVQFEVGADLAGVSVDRLLARVALLTTTIKELKAELDLVAPAAHDAGATWADVGRAAGIAATNAHRRWTLRGRAASRASRRRHYRPAAETTGREADD